MCDPLARRKDDPPLDGSGDLETEKHFRHIMAYRSLWVLESVLRKEEEVTKETDQPEVSEAASRAADVCTTPLHMLQSKERATATFNYIWDILA